MRLTPVLAAALAAQLISSTARADIPPPDDQVKSCVEEAVTKRVLARAPALGPAPCRVVPPFEGPATYPAEAMGKRDAEQKSAGYTWICPLTRNYRDKALFCKLPEGMSAEDALHGPDPAPTTGAPTPGLGETTGKRGCAGCATGATPAPPLGALGLVMTVGAVLAVIRRRRRVPPA